MLLRDKRVVGQNLVEVSDIMDEITYLMVLTFAIPVIGALISRFIVWVVVECKN